MSVRRGNETAWTKVADLVGNCDQHSEARRFFPAPVAARYVRFQPLAWPHDHGGAPHALAGLAGLRADVLLADPAAPGLNAAAAADVGAAPPLRMGDSVAGGSGLCVCPLDHVGTH